MKIKSLEINGIGGIDYFKTDFNERMNYICGPNGIGKTTIIECIAHSFSLSNCNILKRNVAKANGSFTSVVDIDGTYETCKIAIDNFLPNKSPNITGLYQHSSKLLSLKVNRNFEYKTLDAVTKDILKDINSNLNEAKSGINIGEVKSWFVNRYLYSAHDAALTKSQLNNLKLAKKCFSILDYNVSFSRVAAASNEIMINTPNGEIYYEYLSSGFKSSLSIIFGIIKDIELRFSETGINAHDFDGIVLIDELEVHLHPAWQSKIAKALQAIFPKVQFIVTTHSPHVIQSANAEEIIALAFGNDRKVFKRNLEQTKYGYQGWTIEEILVDVMGMPDTRTESYYKYLHAFEDALKHDRVSDAKNAYAELDQLLHPNSHLRKLFRLDLASIGGLDD